MYLFLAAVGTCHTHEGSLALERGCRRLKDIPACCIGKLECVEHFDRLRII